MTREGRPVRPRCVSVVDLRNLESLVLIKLYVCYLVRVFILVMFWRPGRSSVPVSQIFCAGLPFDFSLVLSRLRRPRPDPLPGLTSYVQEIVRIILFPCPLSHVNLSHALVPLVFPLSVPPPRTPRPTPSESPSPCGPQVLLPPSSSL